MDLRGMLRRSRRIARLGIVIVIVATFVLGALTVCLPGQVSQGDVENVDLEADMEVVNPLCPFSPLPPVWVTAGGQDHSVVVRWAPNPISYNIQWYRVYHRHAGSDGWQKVEDVPFIGGTMQYVDGQHGGLANGQVYDYKVTSCCIAVCGICTAGILIPIEHESVDSPYASATPYTPASPPTNLQGTFVTTGGNHVHLTWYGSTDDGGVPINDYDVFRLSSDGVWTMIGASGSSGTLSYDDFSFVVDSANHYAVAAVTIDVGGLSDECVVQVPGAPGAITNVQVNQMTGNVAQVTWGPPADNGGSGILAYKISRSNPDGSWAVVVQYGPWGDIHPLPPFHWTDTDLEYGRTYQYRVMSWNAIGSGPWSQPVSVTISPTKPGSITRYNPVVDGLSVTLKWLRPNDGGSPLLGWRIYRNFTNPGNILIYDIPITDATVEPNGAYSYCDPSGAMPLLLPDRDYYYKVNSYNAIGEGYGTGFPVVHTPADVNSPVPEAGPDQMVPAGAEVTFDGTASTDNFGAANIKSYTWTFVDNGAVLLDGAQATYTFNTPGTYDVTLAVMDFGDNTASDTMKVTVADVNAPLAVAGADQTVPAGTTVSFDGSASTDDFGIASYAWTFLDIGQKSLSGSTSSYKFNTPGTYTVTLTVKDNWNNSATDTLTITVTDILPPSTTADLSGDEGENQWYTSEVEVTLFSTDAYAEVEWTKYRIDEGSWITYSTAVTVSDDGEHTIEFYSMDTAGNDEVASAVTFKIDAEKPTLLVSDQTKSKYTESDVTLRWTGSDAGSGIDHYEYSADGDAFVSVGTATKVTLIGLEDGSHDVVVRGFDSAGNVAELTIVFDVDTVAESAGIPMASLLLIVVVVAVVVVAAGSVWVWKFKKGRSPKPPASGE